MAAAREELTRAAIDAADKEVAEALEKMGGSSDLKPGIEALREWWKQHYAKVGHKRLARALLASGDK